MAYPSYLGDQLVVKITPFILESLFISIGPLSMRVIDSIFPVRRNHCRSAETGSDNLRNFYGVSYILYRRSLELCVQPWLRSTFFLQIVRMIPEIITPLPMPKAVEVTKLLVHPNALC